MNDNIIKNNRFLFSITMVTVIITFVVTIFQFIFPEVLNVLQRNPVKLTSGEWWRLITPLLVHADGWLQFIFNISCIIMIGLEVERTYGKVKWLLLYVTGGLIGEIAGYVWEPYGAGASVGLCGLLAGVFTSLIWGEKYINTFFSILSFYIVVGLVSLLSESIIITIGIFIVASIAIKMITWKKGYTETLNFFLGIVGLLGGVILLVFHDIHGAAIIGGLFVAIMLHFIRRCRNVKEII